MADDKDAVLTREFVPPEFHDRPYLKDFLDKPWGKDVGTEIFKKLDGAEALIGKRPPENPDPKTGKAEDIEKLLERYRPEKADDYDIKVGEGEAAKKVDPAFIKTIRDAFFDGKVSKAAAGKIIAKIAEYGVENQKKLDLAAANKAKEFDVLAKAYLGEQNKTTMERVRNLLKESLPAAAHGALDTLDEKNLLIMTACVDSVWKKYAPESETKGLGKAADGSSSGAATTQQGKKTEMETLMGTKAFTNFQDPQHEATVTKVRALAREISDLQQGKK